MQYVNLLCAHAGSPGLPEFADAFFRVAGIVSVEERESDSFVEGHYFLGALDGAEYKVSLSDDEGHEDRPFWVHIKADDGAKITLAQAVDRIVQDRLLPAGFQVDRVVDFGKRSEQRIGYTAA